MHEFINLGDYQCLKEHVISFGFPCLLISLYAKKEKDNMTLKTSVERKFEYPYRYTVILSTHDVNRLISTDSSPVVLVSELLLKVIALGIDALEKECVRSGD